jgi:putative Mg2+ transporter-C (MgtC) family protein
MTPVEDPGLWHVVLRLTLATVVGLLLGWNREMKGKPAGLRTHALVSLGAALLALTSLHIPMGENAADPLSRVMQGVITGIGFLGAGVIIQRREGQVEGLTTAATIWAAAALGLACGAGYWAAVATATVLAFAVLMLDGLGRKARPETGSPRAEGPAGPGASEPPEHGGSSKSAREPAL